MFYGLVKLLEWFFKYSCYGRDTCDGIPVTTNIISFLFFITIVYDYIVSLFFYYYCNTSIPDCKGMHSFSVSLSYYK